MGGLVHSMNKQLHIALVGLMSDDLVSASLFGGFRFSDENQKHNQTVNLSIQPDGQMCRGSNVKDTS